MEREKKQKIRKTLNSLKKQMSEEMKTIHSGYIVARLEEHPLFCKAKNILLYHALPDEVQTIGLIEKWSDKKNIYLPVVAGDDLVVKKYDKNNLKTGKFGILEPDGKMLDDLKVLDLIVVPGMAFDYEKNRLGRGKGYYDRLLEKTDCPCIGICFNIQLIERVPLETHDKAMDAVVTETEIIE